MVVRVTAVFSPLILLKLLKLVKIVITKNINFNGINIFNNLGLSTRES